MDMLRFSTLVALSAIASAVLSLLLIGPNLVGIGSICIPLTCGIPLAYIIFLSSAFTKKFPGRLRFFIPPFVILLIACAIIGLSMYDQSPQVMFKRLLSDPIPYGISNIQAKDISTFSVTQLLAFNTTPQAIEQIITNNGLELQGDRCTRFAPFEYFPDVNQDQSWFCYAKPGSEYDTWGFLWVNGDKSTALFRLDFGG